MNAASDGMIVAGGYDEFVSTGGWKGAKEKGVVRSEGKEYVVRDGDVMLFRFNV